jgi:hypothetical protein
MLSEIEKRLTTQHYKRILLEEFLKGSKDSKEFKLLASHILSTKTDSEHPSFTNYLSTFMEKKVKRLDRIAVCDLDLNQPVSAKKYAELVQEAQQLHITRHISDTLHSLLHNRPFFQSRSELEKAELRKSDNLFTSIYQPANSVKDGESENSDMDDEAPNRGLPSKKNLGQRPSSGDKSDFLYDEQGILAIYLPKRYIQFRLWNRI